MMKQLDLLNILALITIFTGVVALIDMLLIKLTLKNSSHAKTNLILDYSHSLFPVLLIVLVIRSFIFQPFRVPSESLEPTVVPGDFLFVTQFDYGLKLPLWDNEVVTTGHPQHGQIVVFRDPVNPTKINLVKRVIGIPGDHISYTNKVIYINGVPAHQTFIKNTNEVLANGSTRPAKEYLENLDGTYHRILIKQDNPAQDFRDVVVPENSYFMMGDNRDDSADSRYWGFVPDKYIIGRARYIWLNVMTSPFQIQWHRIGSPLSEPTPKAIVN